MYQTRMINYYPEVIKKITEFQAIIDGEYPEFEQISSANEQVINDAYLTTMSEKRVKQWEKILNIQPLNNSTISDRRDTIIARIRGQGKLNAELINNIVSSFTGYSAESQMIDGVLHIKVKIPPTNKPYKFRNLEKELQLKLPAHLGLELTREQAKWGDLISPIHPTWNEIEVYHETWDDVLFGIHTETCLISGYLINCSTNNESFVVKKGAEYAFEITPNESCTIDSVKVIMDDRVIVNGNSDSDSTIGISIPKCYGYTMIVSAVANSTRGESDVRILGNISTIDINNAVTITGMARSVDDGKGNVTLHLH